MIGYLAGTVADKLGSNEIIMNVSGVGYRVLTVSDYQKNKDIKIFVHTYVRQDTIFLYGFPNLNILRMFELLITVSGIGPKVAMTILRNSTLESIINAVSKADVSFFVAIPGIGKKGAQKIIIDLKNKVGGISELDLNDEGDGDIVDGLVSMGFERKSIQKVLQKIDKDKSDSEKIKLAIKTLSINSHE